jgi:hypothetical protein
VPEDVRQAIKDQILAAAVDGFEDFLQVTQNITASILCGDMPGHIWNSPLLL